MRDATKPAEVVPIRSIASAEEDPAELNLRVLHCLGKYLLEVRGEAVLARVARAAGLEPSDLDGKARWISAARFGALLAAARKELSTEQEFVEAFCYGFASTRGLGRYLMTLSSPVAAYARGCEMFHLTSRVSTLEFTSLGRSKLRLVYTTKRNESRLVCLSRVASLSVFPTLWDLPRARVESKKCVAEGDECCEYELTVYDSSRRFPAVLGALLGGAAAVAGWFTLGAEPLLLLAPALGGVAGQLIEMYRVNRHNIATGVRAQEILREIAEHDDEARRELNELHQRQNEWLARMDEELAERTHALSEVTHRIKEFQQSTQTTIRGLSHDLRNPLQVLMSEADLLRRYQDKLGPLGPDIVREHAAAVLKIEKLFDEMMQYVVTERISMELEPQLVDVAGLTDRIGRQLRALSYGKPIRMSVVRVREAPDNVFVDLMLLDRIIDNILTNAVKYTEQGSIVVEVGGTPGFLTLKISDSGRGIEPERLETAFVSGATSTTDRTTGSYGIGLGVVIDLLRRLDGRLEVMSKPEVGTTFWVHVPIDTRDQTTSESDEVRRSSQIVTIRRNAV